MTGRETILERIRQNKPEKKTLPESFQQEMKSLTSEELLENFKESLKKAGASEREYKTLEDVMDYINRNFQNTVNLLDSDVQKNYGKEVSNEELEKTETVILEGQLGVAENGAVWVNEANLPYRLLPFVTRQLVLVLNKKQIVGNMHEAYQNIDLQEAGFGVFISGPSKTADIEQSLVYGAHGAKELLILIHR